jgi:cation:H+ antiporter
LFGRLIYEFSTFTQLTSSIGAWRQQVLDSGIAIGLFVVGAIVAIWATERLLEGLVGLARLTALSTFAIGAVLSGLEAENIAVGVAAALGGGATGAPIALGTVFGGATFLICVALGLGGILYPMRVRLPASFLVVMAATPVLAGLAIAGGTTSRLAGLMLLAGFGLAMTYLVLASRGHAFMESEEVREASEEKPEWRKALGLTAIGLVAIAIGGELVATGAQRVIGGLGVPALLMGMVITPAAIELEEVIRQAVPTREGHPEVSAGNLVGTLLYFLLFNLGLIALVAPVAVDPSIQTLDWPFLVAATWLATLFLARGQVGRPEGATLLAAYALYVGLHLGR